jgi:hypothetical protein
MVDGTGVTSVGSSLVYISVLSLIILTLVYFLGVSLLSA